MNELTADFMTERITSWNILFKRMEEDDAPASEYLKFKKMVHSHKRLLTSVEGVSKVINQ